MPAALSPVQPIELSEINAARARIAQTIVRTPLVRLELGADFPDIRLKLENLQPINAYKLRGAANAVAMLSEAEGPAASGRSARATPDKASPTRRERPACPARWWPSRLRRRPSSTGCARSARNCCPYRTMSPGGHSMIALFPAWKERSSIRSTTTISSPVMERWDSRSWKTRPTRWRSLRASAGAVSLRGWEARSRRCAPRSNLGR